MVGTFETLKMRRLRELKKKKKKDKKFESLEIQMVGIFEIWKFHLQNRQTRSSEREKSARFPSVGAFNREFDERKENKFKTVTYERLPYRSVRDYNRQGNLLATIELKSINFSCDFRSTFVRMQLFGNDRRQSKRFADWKTYELGAA